MVEYGFTRYLKQAEKPGWSLQIPGSLQFTAVLGIRDIFDADPDPDPDPLELFLF